MKWENGDYVLEDGESLKVPVVLMDSVQRQFVGHRPGFAPITDAVQQQRARTRATYLQKLSDAWRGPVQRSMVDTAATSCLSPQADPLRRPQLDAASAQAVKDAAYRERNRYLESAWRGHDAAPDDPDDDTDDNAATRRERAYQSYKDRLANAWRTGRTVVGAGPDAVGPGPGVVGPGPTRGGR